MSITPTHSGGISPHVSTPPGQNLQKVLRPGIIKNFWQSILQTVDILNMLLQIKATLIDILLFQFVMINIKYFCTKLYSYNHNYQMIKFRNIFQKQISEHYMVNVPHEPNFSLMNNLHW